MPDKEETTVVTEEKKAEYYTVGKLRDALKDVPDDTPIAAVPLNENVRVTIDISIVPEAKIAEYEGQAVLFITGLFDVKTGKEIALENKENADA